jgi:hypothetical protein
MEVMQLVDRTELTPKNTDATIIKILKDLLTSFCYQLTKVLGAIGLIKKHLKIYFERMWKSIRWNVEEMKVEKCRRKHQVFVPIESPFFCQFKSLCFYKSKFSFTIEPYFYLLTFLFKALPVD